MEMNLRIWSARCSGARDAVLKLMEPIGKCRTREDRVYLMAVCKLVTSDKRYMEKWLSGDEIGFRHHIRTTAGMLLDCHAYFLDEDDEL